jgi:glycosyl transferase family 25
MTARGRYPAAFDHFDHIRIVNLDSRPDRRRAMMREIERLHLDDHPSLHFFNAIEMPDAGPFLRRGSHGAFESHLALLRFATQLDTSILILQDDCQFLPAVRGYVPDKETDIFYGGWTALDAGDVLRSDIIGAHCMGFSAKAAQRAVKYFDRYKQADFAVDPIAAAKPDYSPNIRPPIDGALVWFRRANPDLKVVFHKIAKQRSSPSSISPGNSRVRGIIRKLLGHV